MTYDATAGHATLFGGCSLPARDFECTPANDVWVFRPDAGEWVKRVPETAPPALETLALDAGSVRLVLFGRNETWTYDRSTN